jgi:hypothetical protein
MTSPARHKSKLWINLALYSVALSSVLSPVLSAVAAEVPERSSITSKAPTIGNYGKVRPYPDAAGHLSPERTYKLSSVSVRLRGKTTG